MVQVKSKKSALKAEAELLRAKILHLIVNNKNNNNKQQQQLYLEHPSHTIWKVLLCEA
jgi:YbbR domain-containing protein